MGFTNVIFSQVNACQLQATLALFSYLKTTMGKTPLSNNMLKHHLEKKTPFINVFECDLQGNCVDVSKTLADITKLKNEWNLPIRDMRMFFQKPGQDHLPTILPRPMSQCFLVNVGHIKILCRKDFCMILNSEDEAVKVFVDDLKKQLNHKQHHQGMPQTSSIHNFLTLVATQETKLEFAVLETTLATMTNQFKRHLKLLKPILDILLQNMLAKQSTKMLRRMLAFLKSLNAFESTVTQVRSAVVEAFKEEEDLVGLCLSKSGKEEVEEMELLLEAYDVDLREIEYKLADMKEQIDDTNDFINIHLNTTRNNFMKMSMVMEMGMVILSAGALVAGIFGMNLKNGLEESQEAFIITASSIFVGVIIFGTLFFRFVRSYTSLDKDFSCTNNTHTFKHLFSYAKAMEGSHGRNGKERNEFRKVLEPVIGSQLTIGKLEKVFQALDLDNKEETVSEEAETKPSFYGIRQSSSSASLYAKTEVYA